MKDNPASAQTTEIAHNYEFSGILPNRGHYCIRVHGPISSRILRHIIDLLSMTAAWMGEDEAMIAKGTEVEARNVKP